eukprot:SAG11_NODE_2422_length_3379_cov_191.171037_2_plen_742_part_00
MTTLPESFGELTALTTLYLDDNQLTTLPESFGQLTALTTLYLGYNQLTTLPESFGQLTALTKLHLYDNHLTTLPEWFGQLTALTYLDLDDNHLTTLPEWFGQLTALTYLDLSDNQLTTLPESFEELTALTYLTLYNNELTTLPESFGQLTALTSLYLDDNHLTTLPDWFGELTALTSLYLDDNHLTTLPESFYNIHNLTVFIYDDDKLVPCPKLRIPRGGGDNKPFECVCERNYYDTTHGEIHCFNADNRFASSEMIKVHEGCFKCPPCVQCDDKNVTLMSGYGLRYKDPPTLSLKPAGGVGVFNCSIKGTCIGGGSSTNCSKGYTGALCGACETGYGRKNNGTCVDCQAGGTSYTQNLHQTLLFFGVFFIIIVVWFNKDRFSFLFRLMLDAELFEHIKIVIGFFQVVSPLGDVLSLNMEEKVPRLQQIMKVADPLFLSLQDFIQLHCLPGFNNFYPNWLINIFAVPFIFFVGIGLNYLRERGNNETAGVRARTMSFNVGFLLYPRISKHIFEMLNCRRLSENEQFLERDYGVDCDDDTYKVFFYLACVLVVLIPLGVPVILLVKMWTQTRRNYNNFNHDSGQDFWKSNYNNLSLNYEMLVRVYREKSCFYEPVDWLRKMLLGGLLMLLHRGSILQVFVGTCISFSFFGLHMALQPYKKGPTNCLKACVEIQVFLTLFISVLLRFSDVLGGEINKSVVSGDDILSVRAVCFCCMYNIHGEGKSSKETCFEFSGTSAGLFLH